MTDWPAGIGAITLFTEELASAKQFYQDVFGLKIFYEDDDSVVFDFGNTIINLLKASEAADLIAPAAVAGPQVGSRLQLTIQVESMKCASNWQGVASSCSMVQWIDPGESAPPVSGIRAATFGR